MSNQYRLKLPRKAIKIKKEGNFTLDKSSNFSDKIKSNFLIRYYSDPLFTKVSRFHVNKLNNILKKNTISNEIDIEENINEKIDRNKLTSKNFRKKFQLNHIYGYEKEYFRIPRWKIRKILLQRI